MTNQNPIRDAARKKLDDAVTEYAAALWEDRADLLGVGAWIMAIHSPSADDGVDSYLVESAPNQPYHSSVGLVRYAQRYYEGDE